MTFLSFSPLAAYGLLAAVAALIVLLYLIKPRTLRVAVASTVLWHRVLRTGKHGRDRRRWLLSVLLALAIGLCVALALTHPELRALGGYNERIVLILDNSASLAARTRDGSSRWRHALESARGIIQRTGSGSTMLVLDTTGRAAVAGFVRRDDALRQLEQLALATTGTARLPPVPFEAPDMRVHLFTDGVALPRPPRSVIVHSVFEPADNVALTGFEARAVPGDPTRYQAFAQIFNASSTAKHVRLQITSRSGFSLTRDFDVAPGRSVDRALDVSGFEQGVLRAQLQLDGDAFALDDVAFAVVTPHRAKRVLLVTPGNAFLEDSLHALTGVALTVERPAAYRTSQVFDAYVFDRFAPSDAPPGGALLFRPPPAPWLQLATKDVRKPTITAWDESHPVNAGVGWGDVRLLRALLAAPSPDTSVIVSAEGTGAGALLLAGRARAAWIEAGFALEDSNFAMQAGFPVFLGSALTWLSGAPSVLAEEIGHVEVPLSKAQVRDSQGNPIPTADTVDGTAFEAVRPDVYTASGAGRELTVVTNVRDPHYAQIDASWLSARGPDDPSRRRSPTLSWPEGWTALLVLAAVLLVIEWITFSRRITV